MLRGIDISSWQTGINLREVILRNQLDFVIAKATEGTAFTEACDYWVQTCISNGTLWGFYHFARNGVPEEEADYFYQATRNYFHEGLPVLDVECGQSGEWVQRFVDRIHALSGVYPMIYTSTGYTDTFYGTQVPQTCGLWAAQYPYYAHGFDDIVFDDDIGPWAFCAMWQFTSQGFLEGYDSCLDLDYAYMDEEAWHKYCDPEAADPDDTEEIPKPQPAGTHVFEDEAMRVEVTLK